MKKLLVLILALCSSGLAMSTHLRCGYIKAQRGSAISRSVIIQVVIITNSTSGVKVGEDGILSFGDGTDINVPAVDVMPRPDLGPNIGIATFVHEHIYPTLGNYTISYVEANRNIGVLNMNNSSMTPFYTETQIDFTKVSSTPTLLAPPVFSGFAGYDLNVSLGTASLGDDLFLYEIVVPFMDQNTPVIGYTQPGSLTINSLTGLLTWDTQGVSAGEYNFAVLAKHYIKDGDAYLRVGHMRIDFQVILYSDPFEAALFSDNQELDENRQIPIEPGTEKKIKVFYEASAENNPIVEKFSRAELDWITFSTYDSTSEDGDIKVGLLTIAPPEQAVRENAYLITVRGRLNSTVQPQSVSDINYLIYTDEIPPLPEIIMGTEKELVNIEVYPNPTPNQLNIKVDKTGPSEIRLYTMQGITVKTKLFEGETSLTLTDLPPGIYICDVHRNNLSVKKIKLIKE